VSKNADFVAFAESIINAAVAANVHSADELNQVKINGATVADMVNDKLAAIGEKIAVKFERVDAPFVASYIHGANRIGVLVGFSQAAADAGRDVAMQIAAMNPLAVDESSISPEMIAREKEIAIEQIKAEGKPAEMAEKIAKDVEASWGDHWDINEDEGTLTYNNVMLRKRMFVPTKSEDHVDLSKVSNVRTTKGKYTNGDEFVITDDWK
jgi:hypothetical protein